MGIIRNVSNIIEMDLKNSLIEKKAVKEWLILYKYRKDAWFC